MRKVNFKSLLVGTAFVVLVGLITYAATGVQSQKPQGITVPAVAQAQTSQPQQAAGGNGIRATDPEKSGSEELPPVSMTAPAPGSAEKLPRSYENAPPQIAHSIEGLVPITLTNNACLICHDPKIAPSVGATPIPPTHLKIDLFSNSDNRQMVVDPSRYNCVLCHVPQENVKPPVANVFQPDFRSPDAKARSTLFEQWNEGAK